MLKLVDRIRKATKIILSTHRQCDGDGLGAELALFHALKKIGKTVYVVNVDKTPKKYRFLQPDKHIQYFEENPKVPKVDLTVIFDTNDFRMLDPLYDELKKKSETIAFVDHHPVLKKGPSPTEESWIDIASASTGELSFKIIKELGIPLDIEIARALYTSIAFDTQLFRFVRSSPASHLIAAELLTFPIDADEIHRLLFANQTVQKMAFLAKALGQIEYFCDGKLAILKLKDADLFHYNVDADESRDVIDMLMNIETLEAAALFREDAQNEYKLSFRSKGKIEVVNVAENFGGGGHKFASGAFIKGDFNTLKDKIVAELSVLLNGVKKTGS